MMNKRRKMLGVSLLALAITVTALALPGTYAANAVETDRKCSIEFNLAKNVYQSPEVPNPEDKTPGYEAELNQQEITINLYKVADITDAGAYRAKSGFESLELDKISDATTASDWETKAVEAKKQIDGKTPEAIVKVVSGTGKAENLETGMYLITAQEVKSPYFTYTFKENLISLPNNYYYSGGTDEWIYDLTDNYAVGLKPQREERKGELKIKKSLTAYNENVGGATFVFHVKIEKMDGTATTNVYKKHFNGAGNDSLLIENLPAGAEVTVTEIYSGASYTLTSANDQQTVIIAKEDEGNPASVSFTNTYNGGQNGGSGIVNRFYKDGESVGVEAEGGSQE